MLLPAVVLAAPVVHPDVQQGCILASGPSAPSPAHAGPPCLNPPPLPQVKRQCLSTITRMLHFSAPSALEELPLSPLVASLLGARDANVACAGMEVRLGLYCG